MGLPHTNFEYVYVLRKELQFLSKGLDPHPLLPAPAGRYSPSTTFLVRLEVPLDWERNSRD